jgi:hypothetical protein
MTQAIPECMLEKGALTEVQVQARVWAMRVIAAA